MLICAAAEPISTNSQAWNSTHVSSGSRTHRELEQTHLGSRLGSHGQKSRCQWLGSCPWENRESAYKHKRVVAESTSLRLYV